LRDGPGRMGCSGLGITQGGVHILAFEKPEPLMLEHGNYRDAVLCKTHQMVSLEQGAKTLKIAKAILESAKNMDIVRL
jgi:UDP-N-acetylglucosamine 3-dehydrogenase